MGLLGLMFGLPGLLVENFSESFYDNVFKTKVKNPAIGSVVYCELVFGTAEHSGIYIGENTIVHLSEDGTIEKSSPQKFSAHFGGLNTAVSIYVSSNVINSVGSLDAAKRANSMIGKSRNYSLLFDNCYQFTAGCLTGDFENSCNFLTLLKDIVHTKLGGTEWRVWDI